METLEAFNTSGMFHEGVYYAEDKPLYIVEYYSDEGTETFVTVYDVAEVSKRDNAPEEAIKSPRKAYDRRKEQRGFRSDTVLSRLAAQRYKPKSFVKEINRPPLFTAPIEFGRDTFYDTEGMGFFERTKDRFIKKEGKVYAEGGKRTGVFITLGSVDWKRQYVPTEEVLNQYRARLTVWDAYL